MVSEPDDSWSLASEYDQGYYEGRFGHEPCRLDNDAWAGFFDRIADFIVERYAPSTVLDAGFGAGLLVRALRDRGVDASGIDISEYALSQLPPELREHCRLASVTEELPGSYDLVICIEVLEHLSAAAGASAIANFARHTDRVLFSSTPDDVTEPTHVNVQPPEYWVRSFATVGFVPAMTDVSAVVAPQAIVFERGSFNDAVAVASSYENQRYALARGLRDQEWATARAGLDRDEAVAVAVAARETAARSALVQQRLAAIEASTWWRIGAPLREAVTWLRLRAPFVRRYRVEKPPASLAPVAPTQEETSPVEDPPAPITPQGLFTETFPDLWALPVHPAPVQRRRRLVLLTDGIGAHSLFGGVGTALLLGSLLARRLDVPLLVATRTDPPEPDRYADVLRAHEVEAPADVDFAFARDPISWAADDLVLTTSWWSTWGALRTVVPGNIVYLLQEDERLFYPAGDEQLLCAEVLANSEITTVVNTRLLWRHLIDDGFDNLETVARPFEPAFPRSIFHPEPSTDGRRRFVFYARPGNARNLFVRGVTAIGEAIASNVLDPSVWEIVFVGRDIPPVELGDGIVPARLEGLSWAEYAAEIRRADLGLTLIATPHPSYPPLDLAASGAVAVTNRWGAKTSLATVSENIVTTDLDVGALVDGIRAGCELALDAERRTANFERQTLQRDWETAFADLLPWLEQRL